MDLAKKGKPMEKHAARKQIHGRAQEKIDLGNHDGNWVYVDDINYCFCNLASSQFTELHRIAGGATLMAHCARHHKERVAMDSLDEVINKLSCNFVECGDALPFSIVGKLDYDGPSDGRMEDLARDLVSLAQGGEPGFDTGD